MGKSDTAPGLGSAIWFVAAALSSVYFMFAAVQGNYGLFSRIEIEAEIAVLTAERDALAAEVAAIRNKTERLSDDFLDLDLLDQQARDVLGLLRSDEIVIH